MYIVSCQTGIIVTHHYKCKAWVTCKATIVSYSYKCFQLTGPGSIFLLHTKLFIPEHAEGTDVSHVYHILQTVS